MATTFDDPNREAVGLAPIWTGAGDPPPPEGRKTKPAAKDEPEPQPEPQPESDPEHKARK